MLLSSVLCLIALVCTTPTPTHAQSTSRTQFHPAEARILGTLVYTDVTAEFKDIELREVMDFFSTATGLTVAVRWVNERSSIGLDPELPITVSIQQQPAMNALQMILDECSRDGEACTWQLYQGMLEVGTKEWLGRSSAIHEPYDVENLLFEIPDFDNAPTLDLGNFGGGGGGLGGGGQGGGGGMGGGGGGRRRTRRRRRRRRWRRRIAEPNR